MSHFRFVRPSPPMLCVLAVGFAYLGWKTYEFQRREPRLPDAAAENTNPPAIVWPEGTRDEHASTKQKASRWAQAVAEALADKDSRRREERVNGLLTLWARSEPRLAFDHVRSIGNNVADSAVVAVLVGAANRPAIARELAGKWIASDPGTAEERSSLLVGAWTTAGEFALAAQLAGTQSSSDQAASMSDVFSNWAARDPQDAMDALTMVEDDELREMSLRGLIMGWPATDLHGLAEFATSLPEGEARTLAINRAMEDWFLQDPAAFADWLNRQQPSPEFDEGMALLAARADGVNRPPDVAIEWAEKITDPELRDESVSHVLREWARVDAVAAGNYVRDAEWMSPAQRTDMARLVREPRASASFVSE